MKQILSALGNRMFIVDPYRFGDGAIFRDTFTGTGDLTAHSPDVDTVGGGWSNPYSTGGGSPYLSGGVLVCDGADQFVRADIGETDVDITVDFQLNNHPNAYLILIIRSSGAVNNGWRFYMQNAVSTVSLLEGNTSRATGSFTPTHSTWYTARIVANGTSISCRIDGTEYINHTIVTTSSYGSYAGLQLSQSTGTNADNFVVLAS